METELIIGIVAAIAAVFAAVIGAPRILRDARWSIQRDLEIWKSLPENSSARAGLLRKIEREVVALDVHDKKRRNPMGIGLGIAFFVIGAGLLWIIILQGSWWWFASLIAFPSLLLGIGGFFLSIFKTLRDEKGNTIKETSTTGKKS